MKDSYQKSPELENAVMDKITTEKVAPRSKWSFRCIECWIWIMWGVSVLIGAIAVGVSLFVMQYWQYSLYEATHENTLTFLIDALPFLWVAVFGLMIVASLTNLRRTNRGYRHSIGKVAFSSVALSLGLGIALHFGGFGYLADKTLGDNVDMYLSQDELENKIWQMPEDGRLIGQQIGVIEDVVTYRDISGKEWGMDVTELHADDIAVLATEQKTHIIGVKTAEDLFTACGVLEWRYDTSATINQLQTQKMQFAERIYHQFDENADVPDDSVCAEAAMVRKMEDVLH